MPSLKPLLGEKQYEEIGREAESVLYLLGASSPHYGLGALGSVEVRAEPVPQPALRAQNPCRGGWRERMIPMLITDC